MWRARYLAKTILFVTVVAAVIEVAVWLPVLFVFAAGMDASELVAEVVDVLAEGALEGISLAIPMALVTLALFRDPRRLKRYGLAMVIVALVVMLLRWGWLFQVVQPILENPHALLILPVALTLAQVLLNLVNCRCAAGRYRRAALRQASNMAD